MLLILNELSKDCINNEEKGNNFIDLENFKNTGNLKIAENKFENEWSKIETRSRNQNKRSENNQESKNNQEIKI